MTIGLLRNGVRLLIGSPSVNVVPDREIDDFVVPAIQWFAASMKALVSTDEHIGLVAGQREYPIPQVLYFIFVEIAGNLLEPTTTWVLNAGSDPAPHATTGISGQTWRTIAPGTPTRYAVEARSLILYPPASSDFVATTSTMTWRYLSLGPQFTEQSTGLTPGSISGLSDLDLQLIRYRAATDWLSAHLIGQKPEDLAASQAQIAMYQASIDRQLPECKRRWMDGIESSAKVMRVWSDRQGAAR